MKIIPKEKSYVINAYPPFGCHVKKGIDNLPLHPFTLLLVEVPVRTNDHQCDRSSGMLFLVGYLDKNIKSNIVMRRICGGDGFGVPRAKRSGKKNKFFLPKSQNEGPRIHCGKNHGIIGKAVT